MNTYFSVKLRTAMLTVHSCLLALPSLHAGRALPPSTFRLRSSSHCQGNNKPRTCDLGRAVAASAPSPVCHMAQLLSWWLRAQEHGSLPGPGAHFQSCSCCQHQAWPSRWVSRWEEEQLAWGNWESEDYHPESAVGLSCFKNNYFNLYQWNRIGLSQNREEIVMLLV